MLRRLSFLVLIASVFICLGWAQISDPPDHTNDDVDDPDPPLALPLNVGSLTSSGLNYHALVPKESGPFDIVNLGSLQASVLLVTEGVDQVVQQVEILPGQKATISGDLFEGDVLVVSLQAFSVFTAKPCEMNGQLSQKPIVNPPTRHVRIAAVHMLDGTIRPVAITEDNRAYYPVFIHRQPIGEWSPETKALVTDQGVVLEGIQAK